MTHAGTASDWADPARRARHSLKVEFAAATPRPGETAVRTRLSRESNARKCAISLPSYAVLELLRDMAFDLTWSWEPKVQAFFQTLDPQLWEESSHNPVVLLDRLGPEGISRAMERPEVQAAWEESQNRLREHRERRPPPLDAG